MNKNKNKLLLILVLTLPIVFLSGCDDVDWDLLEIFVQSWAEENGLYKDGKYSPVPMAQKVAQDTVRDLTNDEPFIQLDGLDVIRDIEQADDLAEEALRDLDADKMASARSIRPEDWRLAEQEGVIWLANENEAAAQTSFTKSDQLLLERVQGGGDCFALRRSQLETRLFTLSDAITTAAAQNLGGAKLEVLRAENRRVADELTVMTNSGQSDFCK